MVRPVAGVLGELLGLALVGLAGAFVPRGLPFLLYVLVAELTSTYLVHCPAHYIVGRAAGIRFVEMKLGRTTLAKALPPQLSGFASSLPILTLVTDRESLVIAGRARSAAMYASGVVASVLFPFVIAAYVTPGAAPSLVAVAWGVAIAYFLFDLAFSPKTGDIMRARKATSGSASEPVRAQE